MKTKQLIFLAFLVVMAGVLHFIEILLPIPFLIPGFKIGLANIVTLYSVAYFSLKQALFVVILRILLGSSLSGTLLSATFFMALGGCLSACIVMFIINKHCKIFSLVGVSVFGAVAHNFAQLIVATIFIGTADIFYYLPYLTIFGVLTGSVIGILVLQLTARINPLINPSVMK